MNASIKNNKAKFETIYSINSKIAALLECHKRFDIDTSSDKEEKARQGIQEKIQNLIENRNNIIQGLFNKEFRHDLENVQADYKSYQVLSALGLVFNPRMTSVENDNLAYQELNCMAINQQSKK